MKVNVYVDGFNLYYRALKQPRAADGTSYKWLDLRQLCEALLKSHTVNAIRYFTARVKGFPGNPDAPLRQQAYLRALVTLPGLTVHYGNFLHNKRWSKLVTPLADGTDMVKVHKTEEKGSDVNLAAHLLMDGFRNAYEGAAVITNDSDLAEPIRMVRDDLGLPVTVLDPCGDTRSGSLRAVATLYRPIRTSAVAACQFPPTLSDATGPITRPARW